MKPFRFPSTLLFGLFLILLNACEKSGDTDEQDQEPTLTDQFEPNSPNQKMILSEMAFMHSGIEFAESGFRSILPAEGTSHYQQKHLSFANKDGYILTIQQPNNGEAIRIPYDNDLNNYSFYFTLINKGDTSEVNPNAYIITGNKVKTGNNFIDGFARKMFEITNGSFSIYPVMDSAFKYTPNGTPIKSFQVSVKPEEVSTSTSMDVKFSVCQNMMRQGTSNLSDFYETLDNFNHNIGDTTWIYIHSLDAGHTYVQGQSAFTPPPAVQ